MIKTFNFWNLSEMICLYIYGHRTPPEPPYRGLGRWPYTNTLETTMSHPFKTLYIYTEIIPRLRSIIAAADLVLKKKQKTIVLTHFGWLISPFPRWHVRQHSCCFKSAPIETSRQSEDRAAHWIPQSFFWFLLHLMFQPPPKADEFHGISMCVDSTFSFCWLP